MFAEMRMVGLQPDVVAYTSMLYAYSAGGKIKCFDTVYFLNWLTRA